MLLIRDMHGDLIISRISIHEAEKLVPRGRIHELIDSWEWEAIIRASFVKINEVDTGSTLAIVLLYQGKVF